MNNRYSPTTKQLIDAARTELSIAQNRHIYTKHVYFARKLLGEVWRRILAFDEEQRTCHQCGGYTSNSQLCERCEEAQALFDTMIEDDDCLAEELGYTGEAPVLPAADEEEEEETSSRNTEMTVVFSPFYNSKAERLKMRNFLLDFLDYLEGEGFYNTSLEDKYIVRNFLDSLKATKQPR